MDKPKTPAASVAAPKHGGAVTYLVPRRVLELVKPQPNAEVVALLRELLEQAEAGKLNGLVAVPLYTREQSKKYGLSTAGAARDNPQLAVGAVDLCHMLLREIALKDAGIG